MQNVKDKAPPIDLTKYIEIRLFENLPHIRDRRVPVTAIAYNAIAHGWDVPRLAYEFGLSEMQVLAALLYYEQNKEEVDARQAEYQAGLDEMYRLYGGG